MRKKLLCIICCLSCLLSGCVALPGQEPFGEKTYSDEKAQTVYEDISSSMAKIDFEDWNGFSISSTLYSSGFDRFDIYKTEEYTVAYCQIHHNDYFIWNDGRLYYYTDDKVFYRNMNWDEIVTESFVMERWEIARQLLELKDMELTYKHIPMADNQKLLKAKYPETEIGGQKIHSAELLFYLNENGEYDEVTLHCVKEGENEMSITFFPYEGTTDVQAERKLWSFGYDVGLLDRGVPALSQQEENREWSREIIDSIDFASLIQGAEYAEDLTFPDLTTLLAEMAEE